MLEANAWLQDDRVRHEWILDIAERNSVIEGLPPFSEEFRRQLLEQLKADCAAAAKNDE